MSGNDGDGSTTELWDCSDVAYWYDAFNRRHSRYRNASRTLVAHAELPADATVLDFGAGTGLTTEAALSRLGPAGRIVSLEPAAAMRSLGEGTLDDARVRWVSTLESKARFDCVLCSAVIWQIEPFEKAIAMLADHVAPGGSLSFNIPAAYLGEPDDPGEGRDPYLTGLISMLADPARRSNAEPLALPTPDGVTALLSARFKRVRSWSERSQLSQAEFRDWMKIPVINAPFFDDVPVQERADEIDAAFERCDVHSWRWEKWLGWTACNPK